MCGIAAHLRLPRGDADAVRRMMGALVHRGPDGEGLHADGPVALGHRRLSIIDLAGGAQPIFNEDRRVAVVLNGEIYNYRELAEELGAKHTFRTASDTEVLVHLYEECGTEMLSRLRGMFAFVIWDSGQRRLFAARDRFGKKPLYYVHAHDELWIASELRALGSAGAPLGGIDREALADYLSLLYVPGPRTIWSGARKLLPGHFLVADADGLKIRRYWSPPTPGAKAVAPGDSASHTRDLLEESVRLRLRSDVPLAVLLSGGIDSAVITALAARQSTDRLQTFSVGFGRDDDELPHARQIAQRYGTEHREVVLSENIALATSRALGMFSEPFGDSSAVPSAVVFGEVAKHVKVVLTGDGGDEMFAGYDRYRQVARLPFVPFAGALAGPLEHLPAWRVVQSARRASRVLGARAGDRYRAMVEVFSNREVTKLLGTGTLGEHHANGAAIKDADAGLTFDLRVYLPDDLLVKTDITSMGASLEARCPFLDHALAEWVVPMPVEAKQNAKRGKLLLQAAAQDLVSKEIFLRPKRGFGSPVHEWILGPLRTLFTDTVMSSRARIADCMDRRAIQRVGSDVLRGRGNGHKAWALLALEHWMAAQ